MLAWLLWKANVSEEEVDRMLNAPGEIIDTLENQDQQRNAMQMAPRNSHPALSVFRQVKELLQQFRS